MFPQVDFPPLLVLLILLYGLMIALCFTLWTALNIRRRRNAPPADAAEEAAAAARHEHREAEPARRERREPRQKERREAPARERSVPAGAVQAQVATQGTQQPRTETPKPWLRDPDASARPVDSESIATYSVRSQPVVSRVDQAEPKSPAAAQPRVEAEPQARQPSGQVQQLRTPANPPAAVPRNDSPAERAQVQPRQTAVEQTPVYRTPRVQEEPANRWVTPARSSSDSQERGGAHKGGADQSGQPLIGRASRGTAADSRDSRGNNGERPRSEDAFERFLKRSSDSDDY